MMVDRETGGEYERGLALQRTLPGYGEEPRHRPLGRGESAGEWASLGEWTDFGPFGWLLGTLAGLIGWILFRRRRMNADEHR